MEDKKLKDFIGKEADKVVSNLSWHDTLDVQSAVKKAFDTGFRQGLEHATPKAVPKTVIKGEVCEKPVTLKPKKKGSKKSKRI